MLLDLVNVFMTQRDREEAGRRLTYFAGYHLIWWTFFPRVYTYFVTFNPTTNKDTLKWRTTLLKKKSYKRRVVDLICLSSVNYSAKSIHQRYHQVNINTNKIFQRRLCVMLKILCRDHEIMTQWSCEFETQKRWWRQNCMITPPWS